MVRPEGVTEDETTHCWVTVAWAPSELAIIGVIGIAEAAAIVAGVYLTMLIWFVKMSVASVVGEYLDKNRIKYLDLNILLITIWGWILYLGYL